MIDTKKCFKKYPKLFIQQPLELASLAQKYECIINPEYQCCNIHISFVSLISGENLVSKSSVQNQKSPARERYAPGGPSYIFKHSFTQKSGCSRVGPRWKTLYKFRQVGATGFTLVYSSAHASSTQRMVVKRVYSYQHETCS